MAIICQHCVNCFNIVLRVYQLNENGRLCMSKITNTGITDKWGLRHTSYVALATQNLKDFRNSSLWTSSNIMDISRSKNKILAFVRLLA